MIVSGRKLRGWPGSSVDHPGATIRVLPLLGADNVTGDTAECDEQRESITGAEEQESEETAAADNEEEDNDLGVQHTEEREKQRDR
jgi:hypothetical protein